MQLMSTKEELKGAAKEGKSLQVACWLFKDAIPETNSKHLLLIKKTLKGPHAHRKLAQFNRNVKAVVRNKSAFKKWKLFWNEENRKERKLFHI